MPHNTFLSVKVPHGSPNTPHFRDRKETEGNHPKPIGTDSKPDKLANGFRNHQEYSRWILDDLWKYLPKSRPKTIKGLTWTALLAPVCSFGLCYCAHGWRTSWRMDKSPFFLHPPPKTRPTHLIHPSKNLQEKHSVIVVNLPKQETTIGNILSKTRLK